VRRRREAAARSDPEVVPCGRSRSNGPHRTTPPGRATVAEGSGPPNMSVAGWRLRPVRRCRSDRCPTTLQAMRDDLHELPTPRTTLAARYVRVVLTCWLCRHQRDADLQTLVDAGRGVRSAWGWEASFGCNGLWAPASAPECDTSATQLRQSGTDARRMCDGAARFVRRMRDGWARLAPRMGDGAAHSRYACATGWARLALRIGPA